jgi:hypothetical protein
LLCGHHPRPRRELRRNLDLLALEVTAGAGMVALTVVAFVRGPVR